MGQDSLDRIKEIMLNHEAAIDNDQLWKAISSKKLLYRRKKIGGGIIGLSLLLSLAAFWYFSKSSNDSMLFPAQAQTTLAVENVAQENNNLLKEEKSLLHPELAEFNESSISTISDNISDLRFANANIPVITKENYSISSNSKTAHNALGNATHKPIINSTTSKVISEENKASLDSGNALKEALGPIADNLPIAPSVMKRNNALLYLDNIGRLDIKQLFIGSNKRTLDLKLSNEIECYQHGGQRNVLFLVAYTSIDMNFKSMSTGLEFSDYMEERKSSESQLLSYHAGIQLKYMLNNGLYLKGGLEYGQVRERFAHRKVTESTEILPGQIIQIDITPTGDTILVYGNAPVTTIEMKNWRVGNTYKTLDITTMIGYQLSKGSLVYSAELGASLNTRFSFKGLILDETDNPFHADTYFKNKIGWSVLGAVNLGYKMNSRVTAFTGINFKHNLQNINTNINVVDQKYTNIGIHFGLEFKLN